MDFGGRAAVRLAGDIEITLHEASSGTLLFRAWFNTAMLPIVRGGGGGGGGAGEEKKEAEGEEQEGREGGGGVARGERAERVLELGKLELDKLHGDKKNKNVGADYGLVIKFRDCEPVLE